MPSEPFEAEGKLFWRVAPRGINNPMKNFDHGCRDLRAQALHFQQPHEVQHMSVSFVRTGAGRFVSGLSFVDKSGQHYTPGYLHQDQNVPIPVPTTQRIQGWELALDISGIRAIAIITEDGAMSSWAGEPGDFPRWHLTKAEGISTVEAEFGVSFIYSFFCCVCPQK
ncbi:hypothetical protein B0T10DRAFT_466646 [Thelonectria olida]|uniref:DUF7600 domain-containing protein n=1 Tax=Thelonectria olida TaxID=1576542 RepID=A0A9P8VQN9_9HYPO|nr:hypothetical protein B0T10DRAFT_466646 [Thelonectria olida]